MLHFIGRNDDFHDKNINKTNNNCLMSHSLSSFISSQLPVWHSVHPAIHSTNQPPNHHPFFHPPTLIHPSNHQSFFHWTAIHPSCHSFILWSIHPFNHSHNHPTIQTTIPSSINQLTLVTPREDFIIFSQVPWKLQIFYKTQFKYT
jgi:hypothetical protein